MATTESDFHKALRDPRAIFTRPDDVLHHDELDRRQKREVLERWRHDAERLAGSAAEGMDGGESPHLHRVLEALSSLENGNGSAREGSAREAPLEESDPARKEAGDGERIQAAISPGNDRTVGDFLDGVAALHRRLQLYFKACGDVNEDERAEMVLRQMREHERAIRERLESFGEDRDTVLDVRLRFAPTQKLAEVAESIDPTGTPSFDDALARAREVDHLLRSIYDQLSGTVAGTRARELFEHLTSLMDAQLERRSWEVQMARDL